MRNEDIFFSSSSRKSSPSQYEKKQKLVPRLRLDQMNIEQAIEIEQKFMAQDLRTFKEKNSQSIVLRQEEQRLNRDRKSAGSWSLQEKFIYLKFLMEYKDYFKDQQMRRRSKIFKALASLLPNRTPDQCRRHHQQYTIKLNYNIDAIIRFLKIKMEKSLKNLTKSQKQLLPNILPKTGVTENGDCEVIKESFYLIEKINPNKLKIFINEDQIVSW